MGPIKDIQSGAEALARELTNAREDLARVSDASRLAAAQTRLEALLHGARSAVAGGDARMLGAVLSEADRIGRVVGRISSPGLEGGCRDAVGLLTIIRGMCAGK